MFRYSIRNLMNLGTEAQMDSFLNKAVYTATQVACGWAGGVIRKVLSRSSNAKTAHRCPKKPTVTGQLTDTTIDI